MRRASAAARRCLSARPRRSHPRTRAELPPPPALLVALRLRTSSRKPAVERNGCVDVGLLRIDPTPNTVRICPVAHVALLFAATLAPLCRRPIAGCSRRRFIRCSRIGIGQYVGAITELWRQRRWATRQLGCHDVGPGYSAQMSIGRSPSTARRLDLSPTMRPSRSPWSPGITPCGSGQAGTGVMIGRSTWRRMRSSASHATVRGYGRYGWPHSSRAISGSR